MRRKMKWRVLAGACAAAMVMTSLPFMATQVSAEPGTVEQQTGGNDLKLWYSGPADITSYYQGWQERSLPIGNGAIGGSVFGGITRERIQLNEKSLWSGGPSESRPNYNGGNREDKGNNGATMSSIHNYFANGQDNAAVSLAKSNLVGVSDDNGANGYGYYLSFGNMYIDFKNISSNSDVSNYTRDLDLNTAIAGVNYNKGDTRYSRENFTSYPDNVIVTHITADGSEKISLDVSVEPDNTSGGAVNSIGDSAYKRDWNTTVSGGLISVNGQLKDNQMKFTSQTQVITDNAGTVTDGNGKVSVSGASEVTIITSMGTDYKDEYPSYRTGESADDLANRVKWYVDQAAAKSYGELKANHVGDYQNIFNRVDLDLGQTLSTKTTEALLNAYKAGSASEAERRQLEVMLFQYGRFMTIESSRETRTDGNGYVRETLPSNLQGLWVGANNSPWHADYHMNVNLQMNYWPTYTTNMAECAQPLIDYIDALRAPGRVTAAVYAGVSSAEGEENGFMAHTQNNPFGWTCPGWDFSWGWSPAAVPWILQNCWSYYEYTGDTAYLRDNIYPMMKEEAKLYDQMLVRGKDGKLVSSPAFSPEHGPVTNGNTYEQSLIWQLYEDTIKAAEVLGTDGDLVARWKANQADLKGPIEIGDSGQIKEWYTETTVNSMGDGYGHRHMSHMLGLYPGDLITEDNAEWFAASKVSMQNRTVTGNLNADVAVTWGEGKYQTTPGTYTLEGILTMGENMANPDSLKASVQVTVTRKQLEIKSVAALGDKEVAYGTAVSELNLPTEVEVTYTDETTGKASVTWNTDSYDGNTAGGYTLIGTLSFADNVTNPQNLTVSVLVKVAEKEEQPKPEQKKEIKAIVNEKLDNISVPEGTLEANLGLPGQVEVELKDGTKVNVDVEWNLSEYKADKAGTYTLTGELVLGDEFENPNGLKVSVDVIVTKIKGDDGKGDDNKGDNNKDDGNKGDDNKDNNKGDDNKGGNDVNKEDGNKGNDNKGGNSGTNAGNTTTGTPSGSGAGSTSNTNVAKTGDTTPLMLWGATAVLAAGAVVMALARRRKRR